MRYAKILWIIVLSGILVVSCKKDEPVCYEPTTVTAQVKYIQQSIREFDTMIGSVLLDTYNVYINDTILPYLNAINLEVDTIGIWGVPNSPNLFFYLNPNNHFTSYAIRYDTVGVYYDTITIFHHSYPVFISNDCGYTHYFGIDSIRYRSDFVDSTFISNNQVTLENANNAKMALFYFFKTL